MARLSTQYAADLGDKAHWPLEKFFGYVKNLPYRRDPKNMESIARPALTMQDAFPWRDCDDKAILLGAWCASNFVPFRFVASSKRPDKVLHHVYLEARGAKPIILDATYSHNKLGAPAADYTHIEPLTGWIMPQLQVLEGSQLGFSLPIPKSVRRATSRAVKVATTPVRVAKRGAGVVSRVIGRAMPGPIRRAIESAVRKLVGNKQVTPTIKAAIIAPATATALAIPGVQPFAAAVPSVINEVLDAMIAQAKKSISPSARTSPATIAKGTKVIRGIDKTAITNLRARLIDAKAKAKEVMAVKKATAPAPAAKSNIMPLAIGAAAVAGFLILRKK